MQKPVHCILDKLPFSFMSSTKNVLGAVTERGSLGQFVQITRISSYSERSHVDLPQSLHQSRQIAMVGLDPIYISSDEEGDSSKKVKSKKAQRLQNKKTDPRARAKSFDLKRSHLIGATYRSSSAPSILDSTRIPTKTSSDPSFAFPQQLQFCLRAKASTKPSTTTANGETPPGTAVALDLLPPIEPLHFPERYGMLLGGETTGRMGAGAAAIVTQ